MTKHGKPPRRQKLLETASGPPSPRPWFHAAFGCLLGLTVFLSGEQVERSGVFHLPCILWLLAVLSFVVKRNFFGRHDSKTDLRIVFSRLDLFVYAFFALAGFSIFWNLLPGHGGGPRPSLNMLSVWISLAAAWFLFRQLLHGPRIVGAALALMAALALSQASLGLYQQFIDIPAMLRIFEANPAGTIAQIDPSIQPGTPEWDRLVSRLKTAGPMGTYPMTNTLGGFLGTWLVFLLGVAVMNFTANFTGRRERLSVRNVLLCLTVAVVAVCFVLTKCRSAYVAVALGVVLLLVDFCRNRFEKKLGKGLLLFALAAAVLIGGVGMLAKGKTVLAGAKRSLGFRIEYWEASLGMIRDYPLFGCGGGNFKQTYTKYKLPGASEEIADPHNFVVEIAAVNGLPALLVFAAAFGLLIFRGLFSKPPETATGENVSETDAPPGADVWLYWGGLAGCVMALLISYHGEAPMDPTALGFAVVGFAVFGSQERRSLFGNVPRSLSTVTMIVLAVHLLAAGGISVTNTAICFWFLAAISANREPVLAGQIVLRTKFGKYAAFSLLIAAMVFVHHYGMNPVLNARRHSIRADAESRDFFRPGVLLDREAATWADPWSAICREQLATERFRHWLAAPGNEERKTATLRDQDEAIRLLPRSASFRYIFAERLAVMYEKTGDVELRDRALARFRETIERYPNHAKYRAPYALFLHAVAGDDAEKRREARHQRDEALRLDDLMTHTDQKLPEDLRQRLLDPKTWE